MPAINEKKKYPPWECETKDQSITLWTLEQYFERAKNLPDMIRWFGKNDEWIRLDVSERYYTLGLKLLHREKEEKNGRCRNRQDFNI